MVIVFNLKAIAVALVGVAIFVTTDSIIQAGIGVATTDLTLRYISSYGGVGLFHSKAGGTLFWAVPAWTAGVVIAICGALIPIDFTPRNTVPRVATAPDDRHLIEPPPPPSPMALVRFTSKPDGADVRVDGNTLGVTPLETPLPVGVDAKIEVAKEGFVAYRSELKVPAEDAGVGVTLVHGRTVSIDCEPFGAKVELDGEPIGTCPRELVVPAKRRFVLGAKSPGYQTWTKKMRRPRNGQAILARLKPLPLSKLPLEPEDRDEIRDIREETNAMKRKLAIAGKKLKRLRVKEKQLIERGGSHYDLIQVQNRVPDLEVEIQDLRAQLQNLRVQMEGVRMRAVARLQEP